MDLVRLPYYKDFIADSRTGDVVGNVLFGGVDAAKFNSPIVIVPMITDGPASPFYTVPWSAVTIGVYPSDDQPGSNQTFPLNVPAVLDTGTATVMLPPSLFQGFGEALGITDPDNTDFCAYKDVGL